MTLKNAALLALIGTILATVLLVWTFVIDCPECPARIGSSANAVPVVHLCVRWLQRGGVLLCVPESAVVTLARAALFNRLLGSPGLFWLDITSSHRNQKGHAESWVTSMHWRLSLYDYYQTVPNKPDQPNLEKSFTAFECPRFCPALP